MIALPQGQGNADAAPARGHRRPLGGEALVFDGVTGAAPGLNRGAACRTPRSVPRVAERPSASGRLPHHSPMDRSHALDLLREHKAVLAERYGVCRLALFGSTARGAAREDSDVDVLVTFDGPASSARYFGVQFYLEDRLGRPVDLITDKALRERLRPFVERDAIVV